MAYERTWQFLPMQGPRAAVSVADSMAYPMWVLKSFLKGEIGGATQGLWTCVGSSNGTTGALDGVDRWGTTYNVSNIPLGNSGSAHGWILLSRPITVNSTAYTVYLCLSMANPGGYVTTLGQIGVYWTLGTPSGGTSTTDPGLPQVFGQKNSGQAGFAQTYVGDFGNSRRWYGGLTSVGDFWFVETIVGELSKAYIFANPVGTKTNDQFPFWTHAVEANANAWYPCYGATFYTKGGDASPNAHANQTKLYNAGLGFQFLAQPPDINNTGAANIDSSDLSLYDFPAHPMVWNATSSPTVTHARGRLADIGVCGGNISAPPSSYRPVPIGSTIRNLSNAVEYVTLNHLIVPYNNLLS